MSEEYEKTQETQETQETPPVARQSRTVAIVVASTLSLIGLAMQFQSVNLLTGAGLLWMGGGLAAGGFVTAFATKVPILLKVATALILVFCVCNVVYVEHQLDQRRHEIQQIFENAPS